MKKFVIGILAHVDSGKTTLSEAMLYRAGEIRKLGRVDHKNTFLDTNEIERDRGITIFSKQAVLKIGDAEFTLLDTPGHVDFSAEMERTLQVIDYAVLVISGSDGVQNHTETLWRLLQRYNIPVFIFINKMDMLLEDKKEILAQIKQKLNEGCIDFSEDDNYENFGEELSMCDEIIMEQFLGNGKISIESIRNAVSARRVFPCFFGSALKLIGVDEFLEGMRKYTRRSIYNDEFGAKVFKVSEDEQGVRLTHMKITGGKLRVKDMVCGCVGTSDEWTEKVNQIRVYSGAKYSVEEEAEAGSICAVTGLSKTYSGEGLGTEDDAKSPVLEPVLTYKMNIDSGLDLHNVLVSLRKLEEEDPQLNVIWNERLQEINVKVMGQVQLEVLKRIIKERFGFDVDFDKGSIAYKETIESAVEGVGHYEPLRHYAEVHLLMEPGEKGSGLKFETVCSEDELDRNWQRLILTHLSEKDHIGVLTGSPITDMKITVIAGRAHQKHTEGGDFRQATYRAVRHGLKVAKCILLEPWYEFTLEIPSDMIGRAMNDIQRKGGTFNQPETFGEMTIISGYAPVSEMMDYQQEVVGYTKGRGKLWCILKGYEPCHNAEEVISEIGYDSEKDIDNTADSVFCAHGAGFVVKWDKVYDYMHIKTSVMDNKKTDGDNGEKEKENSKYIESAAGDKELMQIFERTYGPVKRDIYKAFNPKKKLAKTPKFRAKPIPQGPEYLLVDGYNIIFSWDELKNAAKDSLDAARNMLINILCNYQGFRQCRLILVFDAYKVKGNLGEVERVHNIDVVYTKEAETADMYIEKVTHELSKKHKVRVATSDNLEQIIILGNGALRVSADAFKKEVDEAETAIRAYLEDME